MLITRGGQTCRERLVNLKKRKKEKSQIDQICVFPPADWSLLESSWAHHPGNAQPHRQVWSRAHSLLPPRWQPCKITGGQREVFSSPWSALSAVLVKKPILVNSDKNEKLDTYQFPWPPNMHMLGQYRPRSILALAFFFFFIYLVHFFSRLNYFHFC